MQWFIIFSGMEDAQLSKKLKSLFVSNDIRQIYTKKPKEKVVCRKIIYEAETVDYSEKLNSIRENIRNEGMLSEDREQYFSLSEKIVLKARLSMSKDGTPSTRLDAYNDLRYPFSYYCGIKRVNQGFKTVENIPRAKRQIFNRVCEHFDIRKFSIQKMIKFLNINMRRVLNWEAIKLIDEIICSVDTSRKLLEDTEYQHLFSSQVLVPSNKHSFEFLEDDDNYNVGIRSLGIQECESSDVIIINEEEHSMQAAEQKDTLSSENGAILNDILSTPCKTEESSEDIFVLESTFGEEAHELLSVIEAKILRRIMIGIANSKNEDHVYISKRNNNKIGKILRINYYKYMELIMSLREKGYIDFEHTNLWRKEIRIQVTSHSYCELEIDSV